MGWISPRERLGFDGVEVLLAMRLIVLCPRGSSPGPLYRRPGLEVYMSLFRTRFLSFLSLADNLPHKSWFLRVQVGAKGFGTVRFGPSRCFRVLILRVIFMGPSWADRYTITSGSR